MILKTLILLTSTILFRPDDKPVLERVYLQESDYEDAVFQPVVGLGKAQGLEMLPVIGVIIVERKGGNVVETFYHATFVVEVGETQRPADLRHAVVLAKSDHGFQQGAGDFLVVHEIDPAEADLFMVPALVGNLVDDGGDASHHLPVFEGQEKL